MKTTYLTLSDLYSILKKRLLLILAAALICGALGGLLRWLLPEAYSATASFYVRNMQSEAMLKDYGVTSSQLAAVQAQAMEYGTLATESDAFAQLLLSKHGLAYDSATLKEMLSFKTSSTVFTVSVTAQSPAEADAVIRAVEAELPLFIQSTAWPGLDTDFTCVTLLAAAAPATRTTANPVVWSLIFFGGGLAAAYLACLLYFLFADRLRDTEELARVLEGVPLLGTLPPVTPHSDGAEALYAIRERLPRKETDRAVSLAVSSALPREGKSTVAAGLAHSFAVAGKSVLLVDADLRRGEKEDIFLPTAEPGLSEYLGGKLTDPKQLVHPSALGGLFVLPVGHLPISPCEHPFAERMATLLAELGGSYDYIVADFPATSLAPELLSSAADFTATLLVAAPGRSGAGALRHAIAQLESAGGTLFGVVANSLPRRPK